VQLRLRDLRIERGEKQIGAKMGFTSRAKMQQMGVSDLIWGQLTDGMRLEDGGSVSLDRFIHPRIEPEVAVRLKTPLEGRVDAMEAQAAIDGVAPALEIIDSRYRDFKFSLVDVVADNSSSSAFVTGPWQPAATDLSNLGMVMSVDGSPRHFGSTAAILGNPIRSLIAAARLAAESGMRLEEGWIVLLGAATPAEAIDGPCRVRLEAEQLGVVDIAFVGGSNE
jgi:2-oxo-3-hexenedioate decarboxylase